MKWLAVCACLLVPCVAFAQNDAAIHGVIAAQADHSLLPNADIEISNRSGVAPLRAKSDNDGRFSFQRLIPGTYTLKVSREGFQQRDVELSLKPREVQNLTVELAVQGIAQSVDVEAQSTLAETYSPHSTTLEKQTIEALPVDQRNNLPDMIAMSAPGMIRSHDDFVHVRGHEIALNTFINGVSFWENPHTVLSTGFTPDIVETANVITGSFPAEYGNRFGGVVDVVTKSGLSMNNQGAVTIGAGTALRHNAAVEWGGHTERAGVYLYSSAFESARFLSPPDPRAIHDTGRGMHNFLQFDFDVNPSDNIKFVLMGDGTNFQIPKTSQDDEIRPNAEASERTRGQSAVLTWNHSFSKNTLLTTSAYQRWSSMRLFPANDPLAAVAQNDRKLLTVGVKSDWTRFFGRHTVKAGVDLVLLRPDEHLFFYGEGYIAYSHLVGLPHVHLRGPNRGPITFADQQTGGQISGYVQDTVQVTRNLTLNAGLRYDDYNLATSATHFSPRLNVAYRLGGAGTVLHASYNHFFVPPAVENVLISSGGLTRYLQDLPEALPPLRPIVEDQVEVGVTQPFAHALRAGVSSYYRLSNNPVHTVLFPDSRIYAYANFDKGKSYGMEIKVDAPGVARLGLTTYLNYALSRTYFWNPVTAGFVDETHHLEESGRFLAPMDQTHTLNAGVTYHHRRSGLWGGMTFEYGSGTPTEAEEEEGAAPAPPVPLRVPGHFTQNLTVGVDLFRKRERSWIALQFNIENLTNNVYKISQESTFSPGEYFNPRFYSGSAKFHF
jgi:outer membrane receptor protein involved in Fe transport